MRIFYVLWFGAFYIRDVTITPCLEMHLKYVICRSSITEKIDNENIVKMFVSFQTCDITISSENWFLKLNVFSNMFIFYLYLCFTHLYEKSLYVWKICVNPKRNMHSYYEYFNSSSDSMWIIWHVMNIWLTFDLWLQMYIIGSICSICSWYISFM